MKKSKPFFLLFFLALFFISPTLSATDKKEEKEVKKQEAQIRSVADQKRQEEQKKIIEIENFVYTSKGRRDPFFATALNERKRSVAKKEEKVSYELEELRIVGILRTEGGFYAMMEDKQGNGMLFKVGDYVNKNMWIQEIRTDRIVFAYKLKEEIRTISMDVPKK